MVVQANQKIWRKDGEYTLTGRVGLVLPDGKTLLCAMQVVGWSVTGAGANKTVERGRTGDALIIDGTDCAELIANAYSYQWPSHADPTPWEHSAVLVRLKDGHTGTVTCRQWATWEPGGSAGTQWCGWQYKKRSGPGGVLVSTPLELPYCDSYAIKPTGVAAAVLSDDVAGGVLVEDDAARAMCMGFNSSGLLVWVPFSTLVGPSGIDDLADALTKKT